MRARFFRWSCVFAFVALSAPAVLMAEEKPGASATPALQWYRGNTHTHTELCGHADSSPEFVAKWYLDHGYHFLCLSEHNQFLDPTTVKLPEPRRSDFILVPSEEIGNQQVHMTGMNINGLVGYISYGANHKILQEFTDRTRTAGGVPIINHPNFKWQLKGSDVRPVQRLHLFELFNGHPGVNNQGDGGERPSTEALWDGWLSDGMVMYGVSSDDAHHFQKENITPKRSNLGCGWIMVRAGELTTGAIAKAIERGDFYASSGVSLSTLRITDTSYELAVDEAATAAEVAKPEVLGRLVLDADSPAAAEQTDPAPKAAPKKAKAAKREIPQPRPSPAEIEAVAAEGGAPPTDAAKVEKVKQEIAPLSTTATEPVKPGYRIDFIGPGGKVVRTMEGTSGSFTRDKSLAYLRAKVTFVRKVPEGYRVYCAWTQPVFEDGRLGTVAIDNVKAGPTIQR